MLSFAFSHTSEAEIPATETTRGIDRLPRRLGVFSAVAVLVGSTIGSGIFRVPSTVASDVGTLGAIALIWVLGALVALFGALTLAELAAIYPRSGGIYVFLREAYGPVPAFLFGWTELLVIRPSALGAIAMIFAAYTRQLFGLPAGSDRFVAAIAIIALALTNVRSVVWGAMLNNVATVGKIAALAGITLLAFLFGDPAQGALTGAISFQPLSWGGFGVALIAVLWAYDGWADLTFIAGEVRDPERTMPRALIAGTGIVVLLYLAINLAYLYVLPINEMAASTLVAADAATKIFGAVGASIISAAVMLSAFGALNGSTITGPRILYAM
ncbi:MAG TPA: amino acid permease, partial [Longimicrobiales bacterium]